MSKEAPTWRLWGDVASPGAVHAVYLKKVRYHTPHQPPQPAKEASEDDISHLEWETVRVRLLKAGTLGRLVEGLACPDTGELDGTFVNVFLATFRTFTTAKEVLQMLLQRYEALLDRGDESVEVAEELRPEHQKALRLTLQVWLDQYPGDWDRPPTFDLLSKLRDFTKLRLPGSDLDLKVNHRLEKMQARAASSDALSCDDVTLDGLADTSCKRPYSSFSAVPVKVFANQLTRMDTTLFREVQSHQCLGKIWSNRHKDPSAKKVEVASVFASVNHFNAVVFRVQSSILLPQDIKNSERAKLILKWIDIAQELRILKNFSSLKAIISGLQSNPIHRLKKTWSAVPKDKCELFEELARIFSEENNALNQRELLVREGTAKHAQTAHAQDRHLPRMMEKRAGDPLAVSHGTIPYLGTFLTDLLMVDAALPDHVHDGLINVEKKRKEFEILAQIRLLQGAASNYRLEEDPAFDAYWSGAPELEDDEAWRLSCVIEPNEASAVTANAARESRMKKRPNYLGHRKTDSVTSVSSGTSSTQFHVECDASGVDGSPVVLNRKLSTSSTNSSQPSMDVSLHSSGTPMDRITPSASIITSTPEKEPSIHSSSRSNNGFSHKMHNSLSTTSITSNNSNSSLSNGSSFFHAKRNSFSNSSSSKMSIAGKSTGSAGASSQGNSSSSRSPANPYITPDFYIIKVSLEASADDEEASGVLYKSVMVGNQDMTAAVVKAAMEKHAIEGKTPEDYTLAQTLPQGEMILPPGANVYYAINTQHELTFVLRRRRHGDENTFIRTRQKAKA